jgi:hypothetical protein
VGIVTASKEKKVQHEKEAFTTIEKEIKKFWQGDFEEPFFLLYQFFLAFPLFSCFSAFFLLSGIFSCLRRTIT